MHTLKINSNPKNPKTNPQTKTQPQSQNLNPTNILMWIEGSNLNSVKAWAPELYNSLWSLTPFWPSLKLHSLNFSGQQELLTSSSDWPPCSGDKGF